MKIRSVVSTLSVLLVAACGGGGSGGGSDGDARSTDLVSITAFAPAAAVPAGRATQIEVIVANPSSAVAMNVAATLAFDERLTRGTVSCAASGGGMCPVNAAALAVASLPGGAALRFVVAVSVAPGASGRLTTAASVTADGDTVTANNSAQVVVTAYSADLRITNDSAGAEFFSGSIATYTTTLSNAGPDAARDVTIEAAVGPGQTLSSITCAAVGATCPATLAASMTVSDLPKGASLTFVVSASIAMSVIGPISHTLYASGDGDPALNNNVATSSASARVPTSPQSTSFVTLQSDSGDYIGAGKEYRYDRENAVIEVNAKGGAVTVRIAGNESWNGEFVLPSSQAQVAPGTYSGLKRYPFHDAAIGGLSWSGEGRGCNQLSGGFTVESVTYVAGLLATLDLHFEQHCEGDVPALRGQIHWNINDTTAPPGPVNPPPKGLWSPAPGATPSTGNYFYLQSDGGDYIGGGRVYTYTQANALLTLTHVDNRLSVSVVGNENWHGSFQAMNVLSTIQPGYYGNLERGPFHNPTTGGLSWGGEGRGCNTVSGWFVVDSISYSGNVITSLDLRFEQHCEGSTPALRGKIRWAVGDTTQPAGPQVPPPANLWQPAQGVAPASGSYVYLQSQPGDYIGSGLTHLYTNADALLDVSTFGARLEVQVDGDEFWIGSFQGMNSLAQLRPGYYANVGRYPFHNPVAGGLSWHGEGRGCNTLTGWFVVDGVEFDGETLATIDLRFEQHCEGGGPALRGKIHWTANDATQPPGPENPPPPDLWAPPASATPASGNYVYLSSPPGDFVGAGRTYVYTAADAVLRVTAPNSRLLSVSVDGDENWSGDFAVMDTLQHVEPGYYGDLERYPFNNPVRGGLSWSGNGRGCNTLTGWFVIDDITYASGTIETIELRFEQRCDGGAPLRGAVRWTVDDPTQPPGPQQPPPANLWKPAPGATPTSGNYVYLVSEPGDFVGGGQTYTITPATNAVSLNHGNGLLSIAVGNGSTWHGQFKAMSGIGELQPGYYANLQRYPFHNPVRGGLSWTGLGRGCNVLTGWFAIDSITYSAGDLASIDLRFEQHCEGLTPALRGKIHWIR